MKKIAVLLLMAGFLLMLALPSEAVSFKPIGKTIQRFDEIFFSPDGRLYGYEGKTTSIYTIDPDTGAAGFVVKVGRKMRSFTFSPTGNLFAIDPVTSTIYWVQLEGGLSSVGRPKQRFKSIAFSPNGPFFGYAPISQNVYEITL